MVMNIETNFYGYGKDRVNYGNLILNVFTGEVISRGDDIVLPEDSIALIVYASSKKKRQIAFKLLEMDDYLYNILTYMMRELILSPDFVVVNKLLEYKSSEILELYKILDLEPLRCLEITPRIFKKELNKFFASFLDSEEISDKFIKDEYYRYKSLFRESIEYLDKENHERLRGRIAL